ncbi:LysM peptidoglycan-binding domain-containing protein [Paraburkholderia bryophila]|uniref:LysM domain-containing protein n=1 Tax=Paraburkholderia bryophila TaxID=420952 RepID=A0A329C9S7_9BURK|nr:LysM peptidoglycan-binding domain-containing protein [Paraburkholderia bryophila]RAS27795.1 LysM domain-containing protein [Paraburkholderia bryophila]
MFVRATYDREKKTVHYFDADGNETLYIGGSFAWRTSNPGNLTKPHAYVMKSAIGYAQRTSKAKSFFIIFPDRAAGQEAHQKLLKSVYGDSTIRSMITVYAPPSENDTEDYIGFVTKKAGVSSTDVIGSLPDDKFKAVAAAMEQKEGWVPGVIKPLGKPVQVQMLDKLNQPFAGQPMQIKGASASFDAKTNENGELPWIYSGLLGQDVNIVYKRAQDDHENVGKISTSSASNAFTFNAPYHLIPTRPRLHAKDESGRPRVHIVQPGETLSSIAAKYGTTTDAMVGANGLKDANHIYAQQHLKIPLDGAPSQSANQTPAPMASTTPHTPVAPAAPASASSTHANGATVTSAAAHSTPATTSQAPGATSTGATPSAAGSATSSPPASAAASTAGVVHQHAPNGHPQTVVSSPTLEPSGAVWCSRFPGSASLDSLNDSFKAKASAFITAMRDAHILVRINAALRPIQRSYLMFHAFEIAKGHESPDHVEPYPGVNIDWVHRSANGSMDLEASVKAAKEMCHGYGININSAMQAVGRPGRSRHNYGAAVDLNITGYVGKRVKDVTGNEVALSSFADLKHVGHGYGVNYYPHENMHWSDTGH